MTALNPEIKQPQVAQPEKVDANLAQKVDATLTQNQEKIEDKPVDQSPQSDADKDPNWRAFREARKKDRAEKEAAERKAIEKEQEIAALKAAMEAAFSKSAPTPQAYQQYYGMNNEPEETEDQKIEKKVNQILAAKEEQYKKEQAEYEQKEYPKRLLKDFPDFYHVCSQENMDYLDFHYPEVSRPLQRLGDSYEKCYDIYYAIKKFIPNYATAKKEAARAEINNNKPRSISSPELTNSGQPVRENWQQVEQRRAANWARMQEVMKGV